MSAPDLPTWHVADDSDGEPTLWRNNLAVLERRELSPAGKYADQLWSVLTAVLAGSPCALGMSHAPMLNGACAICGQELVTVQLPHALGAPEQTGPDGGQGEAVRES